MVKGKKVKVANPIRENLLTEEFKLSVKTFTVDEREAYFNAGFIVLPCKSMSDEFINALDKIPQLSGDRIFKELNPNFDGKEKKQDILLYDEHRFQVKLDYEEKNNYSYNQEELNFINDNPKLIGEFLDKLDFELNQFDSNFRVKNLALLESAPHGEHQAPHMDFKPEEKFDAMTFRQSKENKYITKNASVIIALKQEVKMVVWKSTFNVEFLDKELFNRNRSVVSIAPGQMLLFRGDLVHAGYGYDNYNRRLHLYVVSKLAITKIRNEAFVCKIMEHKCPHCDYVTNRTHQALYKHIQRLHPEFVRKRKTENIVL